jgi:hypothetical protein
MQISFDIKKITSFEDASAPFILYNSTRLSSVTRKFEAGVAAGTYTAAPKLLDMGVDAFAPMSDQREWEVSSKQQQIYTNVFAVELRETPRS